MAFKQDDEKQTGNFWPHQEEAIVQIDAPTAMGQATTGISDMIAADAAFAGMSPEQAKIAQSELEIAKMAISRGDYEAVERMHFTDPGTHKLAQQMATEEQGRQNFQSNAMGALGLGVAAESGSLFSGLGGVMENATALNNLGNAALGATAGLGATTVAADFPVAKHFFVSGAGGQDVSPADLFENIRPGVTPGAQNFQEEKRTAEGPIRRT